MNKMKKLAGIFILLLLAATAAFADVKPPLPKPSPSAAPVSPEQIGISVSVSRWEKEGTLVLTKAGVEKINAAAKAKGMNITTVAGETAPGFPTQTIIGGMFLSLAFVFGGVWLARSKGQVSKPALGAVLLAVVGMGTTLVIGNVPPPKRVALTSSIFNEGVMRNYVAAGKVKIMIVNYENTEDVMLIIPRNAEGATGETEE
jgi:hypothetical protein